MNLVRILARVEQKTFASRVQEGKDLRAGMETIQSKLKCRQDEEADLRKKLAEVMTRNLMRTLFQSFVGPT